MNNRTRLGGRLRWRNLALALLLGLAIGLAAFTAWLGFSPTGRAVARAGLLVLDILPQSPVSPLRAVTSPPVVEEVHFPYEGGEAEGRLYRPAGSGTHSAIIMSLGYGPNPNDPLLMQVSDDLARLGIAVLIPNTPGLRAGNLVPEDIEVLIGAFEYLSTQRYVNYDRIGFAGFCIGSSIALVAAEDPRINERVSYVNVFGGYYEAREMLRAVATRSSRYKGQEFAWTPARQSIILFAQNVLMHVDTLQDRQKIRRILETPAKGSSTVSSELTPVGRLAHDLLTRSDPATVDVLLAQIPQDILSELELISPSAGIDRLKARIFIMHDVSDPYVPITESYRLADAISNPEQKVYVQLTLFDHLRPSRSLSGLTLLKEGAKLFVYLCKLLIHVTA